MTCSLDGCDRPIKARGLCSAHYFRQRRNGTPGDATIWDRTRAACTVEGCDRPNEAHGLCQLHGRRVSKGGSPDFLGSQAWDMNPAWKGAEVGYTAAHDRVRSVRGPATAQACASCGGTAQHWAYTHDDPAALRTEKGIPYSSDPAYYEALCVPCHKNADLARLAAPS